MSRNLIAAVFVTTLISCNPQHSPSVVSSRTLRGKPENNCSVRAADPLPSFTEDQKKTWLGKAYQTLGFGHGVLTQEYLAPLLSRSRPEILQDWFASPEFGDFVLDFNRYFLGFKRDRLKNHRGDYISGSFEIYQAVHSAQETVRCGNYESLFDYNQEVYMDPLGMPTLADNDSSSEEISDQQKRKKIFVQIQNGLDEQIAQAIAHPERTFKENCDDFQERLPIDFNQFFYLGIPFSVINFGPLGLWYGEAMKICAASLEPMIDFVDMLKNIKVKNEIFYQSLSPFEPDVYFPRTIGEVKSLPREGWAESKANQFSNLRGILPNSSTNYNRKRGAFVLSRYFCDDLTPINIEDTGGHSQGQHGSSPACLACHYRLDPMAGFFKNLGFQFNNFATSDFIIFDDGAKIQREQYQSAWRAPAETGREWNIGFIRSEKEDWRNSYGNDMGDLFKIISQAPEVKRCVIKRLFEYLIAENQTIDPGYLDYLTLQYSTTAKFNSSLAFKEAVADIVMSRSFVKTDLNPQECYDFAPGQEMPQGPPCRVNYLLQKNCVHCHSSNNMSGGLDLTRWSPSGSNSGRENFFHVDFSGHRLPAEVTFQRISDRLTNGDPEQRMPLKQFMESADRESLFLWVERYREKSVSGKSFSKAGH